MLSSIPFFSRYTFRRHLPAAVLDGAAFGVLFGLSDVVLRKDLHGTAAHNTALAMLFPMALMLAPLFSGLMVGRAKRWFFLGAGLFGRIPLLLVPFVTGPVSFLCLIGWSAAGYSVLIPAQNSVFQANYVTATRGRLFGIAQASASAAGAAFGYASGYMLDLDSEAFRVIYPVCGMFGLASSLLLSRIRVRGAKRGRRARPASAAAAGAEAMSSVVASFRILRTEVRFRWFEVGFFVYGLAFMIMQPIVPIYLVDVLHASHQQAVIAKQVIVSVIMCLFLPTAGQWIDRVGPAKGGRLAFATLALFPIVLAAAQSMKLAYVAYVVYGFSMSGVNILWNLASIHFAGERDAAPFQAVHVALVGVRGMIGPGLGLLALTFGSPRVGLGAAAVLFAVGSVVMHGLVRYERAAEAQPKPQPAPAAL